MEDKRRTDGSLALSGKQHRVITIEAAERPQDIKLRVAAYARVSSSSDDQLNSFAAQNNYYTTLIASKENWSLVDIYADEGITGTSAEKRGDFQRMLSDCRRGKIDRVLVKSISRFARNTKECLEAIRELKAVGVSVCFEEQNIDTGTMSGEMVTAMFAALAQAESESISKNQRWGIQKRMQNGTYLPSSMAFGYQLHDKKIEIDVPAAQLVCEIFQYYLSGMSLELIAEEMNRRGIPTSTGRRWRYSTVRYILTNERYLGNSLWQKSYSSDTLPVQRALNKGDRPQYYALGTHPAIISEDAFTAAQELFHQRQKQYARAEIADYPMRGKICCANCKMSYRRKTGRNRVYWVCIGHEKDPTACDTIQIPESTFHDLFCRMYFKLKHHSEYILLPMLQELQTIRERRMLWSLNIIELNKQISNLSSQNQMLAELKKQGLIDPDIFISQSNALAEKLRAAKLEKERLIGADEDDRIAQTRELIDVLDDGPDFLDTFDAELFGELIDKVIVESNERLRFRLKNGLELEEDIERTVR